jgi:branched-subunit amino acid ABC-type transport system permease component
VQGYLPGGTQWSDLYVFSGLIVLMIIRPQGLLGRADIRKV